MAKKKISTMEAQPEQQTQQTNHTYHVVVLGPSGAGKTVYLASMYNKLMMYDSEIGFYLSTNGEDRRELVARYENLKNHKWPDSTRYSEMREWNFTCQVPSSNGAPYTTMGFAYLDYPGEAITSAPDPVAIMQLDDRIKSADALLGIIDGHKIFATLSKKPLTFATSLDRDLGNILPDLQDQSTPAQFIITKWDVLANHGYSMQQVIEYLMTIPRFRTYVEGCRVRRVPVRLVPVSSVGMNYAQLNANGLMEPIGELSPHFTEMPLACVLLDQIEMRLQTIKREKERVDGVSIIVDPKWSFRDLFGKGTSQFIKIAHSLLPEKFQPGEMFIWKLYNTLEAPYDNKVRDSLALTRQLQEENEASLKALKDKEAAVHHVWTRMSYLRNLLEREYPESVLSSNASHPVHAGNA